MEERVKIAREDIVLSKLQKKILVFVLALLVCGGTGSYLWAAEHPITGLSFPIGTWIAGKDVSGLNNQKAIELLKQQTEGFKEVTYKVSNEPFPVFSVKAGDLGAGLDISGAVEKVAAIEGERSVFQKLFQVERRDYPMDFKVTYDQEKYLETMASLSLNLEKPGGVCRVMWGADGAPYQVAGQTRLRVDREASFKNLPAVYRGEEQLAWQMVGVVDTSKVESEQIQGQEKLGSYTTLYDPGNINRTFNLKKGTQALHGATILPGQVFSFGTTVGPISASAGYKEANVIVQNEFTPGIGGGICQVSSTLYNAALLANLPIVERHNHSITVPYLPPGLDATVSYGSKDLRFRNNTEYPLCIKTYVGGGKLTMEILGQKTGPSVNAQIERQILGTTAFKTIRKADPSIPFGTEKVDHNGQNGYSVKTYRNVIDASGQPIKRELISTDYYKPLDKLILVGSKGEPAPEPAPEETDGIDTAPDEPDTAGEDPFESDPGDDIDIEF